MGVEDHAIRIEHVDADPGRQAIEVLDRVLTHHPAFTALMGTGTGVATMMGNVAGPIANIYLLSKGLKKEHFMGSMAWLFLMINLLKVPWFWHLKMITPETVKFNVMLIPAITIGAFCGKALLPHIPQHFFNKLVLALAAAAALKLVLF